MKRFNFTQSLIRGLFFKASFNYIFYHKLVKYSFILWQVWHKSSQAKVRFLLNDVTCGSNNLPYSNR